MVGALSLAAVCQLFLNIDFSFLYLNMQAFSGDAFDVRCGHAECPTHVAPLPSGGRIPYRWRVECNAQAIYARRTVRAR